MTTTTTQSNADIFGFRKITKKGLLESCKKNKLYRTPGLNDVLYLHYQGYEDIECLEEYTGLKCLWLESNAITKISGLDNQKLLKCLFIHNNVIRKIENLEHCPELDTINLSHNHIIKIENCGIDKLPVLTSLNLSHNYLKTYDSLINLIDCKMLSVLDLANNRIEDILCVKIFAQMPELRVLVLQGNPVVNQIPQYRKTLILDCVNLTYLDSRPVFPRDRACAVAWKQGGYEAERIEHARWNREERKKIRQSVNATLRLKNRGGGDPQAQLLMSSDDEDAGITELSSAPSLEKDQAAGTSSKLVKSINSDDDDSDDSDSDTNMIRSIPLFNQKNCTDNSSLFNSEQRCIICSRPNCNFEHIKKRKRIRNHEEPETILEDTLIFDLIEECPEESIHNNEDEENKLYNDVYLKNIKYINKAVSTIDLKNEKDLTNLTIIDQNYVNNSPNTDSLEKKDALDNEKEVLDKEREDIDNEKDYVEKEKDSVHNEKDAADNEKDYLENEKEVLDKEREDIDNEKDDFEKKKDSVHNEKDAADNEKDDLEKEKYYVDDEKDAVDNEKDYLEIEKEVLDKERDDIDNEKDDLEKEKDSVDNEKDAVDDITATFSLSIEDSSDKDKIHKSENLSQLLIRCREQDNDITELSLAPPLKKFKLSEQEDCGPHMIERILFPPEINYSATGNYIKEFKQEENIPKKSLNTNPDVKTLEDVTKDDNLTKKSYNNVLEANNQYITEIVEKHDVNDISKDVEINFALIQSTDKKTTDDISNIESNIEIKNNSPNTSNAENLEKSTVGSFKNIDNKIQELMNFNCSLNLLKSLPPVFSSTLYLGTDTNINSAIALYEMSHKNDDDVNSGKESDNDESCEATINKSQETTIAKIDKESELENLKSKMDIINRLLNDPITKTFQFDSTKIHEDFEILKNDEIESNNNSRLKIFMENENKKIENHSLHDSITITTSTTLHDSKSEINLKNNSNSDDDGKNDDDDKTMIETLSSDTRILKIQYNI